MYTNYCLESFRFKDKKRLNSTTKLQIFDTENKQKPDINKANLHLQKQKCTL